MPTYVYRCEQCGAVIERRQRFQDPPLTECEACLGSLQRVLQPVSVIFRGSGFYSTDYRVGSADGSAGDGKADSTKAAAGVGGESAGESKSTSSAEPAKPGPPAAATIPSSD